jgi:hypothetical protein
MSDSSYIIINERYKVQNLLNILISYVFISEYMSKVVRQIKEEAGDEIEAFKDSVEDEKQIQQLDERYAILLTDEADSIL